MIPGRIVGPAAGVLDLGKNKDPEGVHIGFLLPHEPILGGVVIPVAVFDIEHVVHHARSLVRKFSPVPSDGRPLSNMHELADLRYPYRHDLAVPLKTITAIIVVPSCVSIAQLGLVS